MSCDYAVFDIFERVISRVRDLFLYDPSIPYPVYETRADYDADTINTYKGILVWDAQRYYNAIEEASTSGDYTNDVGLYIVPTLGQIEIVPNVEFRQVLVCSFDTNSDPDYDPFGDKLLRMIHWYVNRMRDIVELSGIDLPNGAKLWVMLDEVSQPIFDNKSPVYVRRVVTHVMRYCQC